MIKQWNLKVFGVVQGVCLRFETRQKARSLNLVGEVQNLTDGSIEIKVVGKETDLEELLNWLKSSPGYSEVTRIKKEKISQVQKFDGFSIMY